MPTGYFTALFIQQKQCHIVVSEQFYLMPSRERKPFDKAFLLTTIEIVLYLK